MCHSLRGLTLGCLAFSITYIFSGCVQIAVGIVFMVAIPVFRLASNIWTGGLNITLGSVITVAVCFGRASLNKHRLCLGISIVVVFINLGNLLILEICEWRAFLPPERIQDIMRKQKTELLLTAYLSSTISTAVALIIGFVACEYIYCLLVASQPRNNDELKSKSKRRGFPCRNRRASWYEPISFSWVFEASDNFNSSHGLMRTHSSMGTANKTFHEMDTGSAKQTMSYFVARDEECQKSALSVPGNLTMSCSSDARTTLDKKITQNGSVHQVASGRIGADSKSSSGYSSPDWLTQRYNTKPLSHPSNCFDNHSENVGYYHVSHPQLSLNYPSQKDCKALRYNRYKREVRSLMQLPVQYEEYFHDGMTEVIVMSPVKQSTLPSRGHRKRVMSAKETSKTKRSHGSAKSPRKRCKTSDFFSNTQISADICSVSQDLELSGASYLCKSERSRVDREKRESPDKENAIWVGSCYASDISTANSKDTLLVEPLSDSRNSRDSSFLNTNFQSNFDVPSSASVSRRSSISEEAAIFDVTANFQMNNSPLMSTSFVDSPTYSQPWAENSSLALGTYGSDDDENKLELSDSPSIPGSLTSVTCPEDGLSPLSDVPKCMPFYNIHSNETLSNSESCNSKMNSENNTTELSADNDEDSRDLKTTEEKTDSVDSVIDVSRPESNVEAITPEQHCVNDTMNDAKECSPVRKVNNEISIKMNGFPPIKLQETSSKLNEPNNSPSHNSHSDKNCVSLVSLAQTDPEILSRHSSYKCSTDLHKLLRKNHKKLRNNTWSPLCKNLYGTNDGVSLQSLDRNSLSRFLEQDINAVVGNTHSDPVLHWKVTDSPQINPIQLDDKDSLLNLSNLELLARQWRTYSLHK